MTNSSLPSYLQLTELRLRRASEHIEVFRTEEAAFVAAKPFELVPVSADAAERYTLKITARPPTHLRFPVGDAIHNLRATLDNLVWGLGQLCGEPPGSGIAFPVCESPEEFERRGRRSLGNHLSRAAVDLVRSLQPFTMTDPRRHVLWVLNKLSNQDKHDMPNLVMTRSEHVYVEANFPDGVGFRIIHVMRDGEEVSLNQNPESPVFAKQVAVAIGFDSEGPQGVAR